MLEHRSSATGRWLRAHRVKLALWIAVAEAILVLVHVIPTLVAVGIAISVVVAYFTVGRSIRSYTGRQAAWVGATSQALVVLVPLLLSLLAGLAIVAGVILVIAALVVLFARR